jgi:predicted dehydrogenase
MKTLNIGMIGFGFMGRTHTYAHRTMPFYFDPPPVRSVLKVVCTSNQTTARAAQTVGGFERWTTDPHAVIADPDIDLIHICTPNHQHLPVLLAAMRAQKHIYVEKPVVASAQEALQLAAALPDYRGRAQVVLQYRFLPATIKARELIEKGFCGPITHFRAAYLHSGSVDPAKAVNWKSTAAAGGGVIRDLGPHILDLMMLLAGPFDRGCCVSRIWSPRRPSLERPGTMIDIDVEDAALMVLRRDDGTFGTVEVSKIATGTEDELRFEIHGRHGAIRFNLMQPNYLEMFDGRLRDGDHGWQQVATVGRFAPPGGRFPSPKNTVGWLRAHVQCLYSLLKCIADDSPASPSLAEGIALQHVIEAMIESARSGQWVDLRFQI